MTLGEGTASTLELRICTRARTVEKSQALLVIVTRLGKSTDERVDAAWPVPIAWTIGLTPLETLNRLAETCGIPIRVGGNEGQFFEHEFTDASWNPEKLIVAGTAPKGDVISPAYVMKLGDRPGFEVGLAYAIDLGKLRDVLRDARKA